MPLIEAKGRPHLLCGKCHTVLVLPETLDLHERQEVARIRRADAMAAIQHLTQHHGLDLREAKAIMLHIPLRAGECSRCHTSIPGGDAVCPKCQSLNLNW